MTEPAVSQMLRRFREMSDEALKKKLEYHQKYAAVIQHILDARKKK